MKLTKPKLPKQFAEPEELAACVRRAQAEEEDISARQFSGETLFGENLSKLCFHGVLFQNCRLEDSIFQKTDFLDVVFMECDLSNCDFSDGYFNRCEFRSCKGLGASMQNARLQNVGFYEGNFRYANFNGSKWKAAEVAGTDMNSANLAECTLTDVGLDKAGLEGASFFKTPLAGMDFTTSRIDGIVLSGEELRGAAVNLFQAAELAKLFGIIIKE